jgi:hypothetical protein
MEQELNRAQVGFRKNDNAFLAVDDVKALQAAADRLSPEIIRERLDYWTLILPVRKRVVDDFLNGKPPDVKHPKDPLVAGWTNSHATG